MKQEGKFLYHTVCPHCGSSDAYSVYSTGTGYCFSCEKYDKTVDGEGDPTAKADSQFYRRNMNKGKKFLTGEVIALTKRGIEEETCQKFRYQVGQFKGTPVQISPYYLNRKLVAQHLRFPSKDFLWLGDAGKVELFGQHLWAAGGRRIIITEGEIDCLSIAQAQSLKWPVVSLPSGVQSAVKYLRQQLEFLESFQEIVLAFDDDKPGREGVQKVAPLFTPGKVKVMTYNGYKDANELLLKQDAGQIVQCMFNAEPFRPDGIVSGKDLWDIIKKPSPKGWPIQYPKLSEMIGGVRKGELQLYTAGSGIGKSTIVNEIAYYLMQEHSASIGVIALEDSLKLTCERYLGIYLNKRLHLDRNGVDEKILRKAYDQTVGSGRFYLYDHWGSLNIDNLLAKLRYLAVGLGVDFIILDHISIVVSGLDDAGSDERKAIDRLMTKLRALIEETGVGVLAVVHLKRTQKNYNEGAQVSLSDLRGSASLEQLSDIVIGLERNQQDEEVANRAVLRVLKNRPLGITGMADSLEYNPQTGRLVVAGSEPFEREDENDDF